MKAGDTFICADRRLEEHLWVVVSDPQLHPASVLIANFTTAVPSRDRACVVRSGEHPVVRQETCAKYRRSQLPTTARLERALSTGMLRQQPPVSPDLLDRIRQAAAQSDWLPEQNRELLVKQGLIDPA